MVLDPCAGSPSEAPGSPRAGRLARGARARAARGRSRIALLLALLPLVGCGERSLATWGEGVVRFEGAGRPRAEEGPWSLWYRDGQLRARGAFEDGLRTGVWETFYPSGGQGGGIQSRGERLPLRAEGRSPRHGPWSFWHPNGRLLRRGRFERGLEEGLFEEWHPNGQAKSRLHYRAGLLEGPAEEWFDDGSPRARGAYAAGLRTGTWEGWRRDGSPDPELTGAFVEGQRVTAEAPR